MTVKTDTSTQNESVDTPHARRIDPNEAGHDHLKRGDESEDRQEALLDEEAALTV